MTNPLAMLNWVNAMNSGCYQQQAPTAALGPIVHIPCGGSAVNVRSHPSFYGRIEGSFAPGTTLTACEQRADSPTTGLSPASWTRVSLDGNCQNSQLWIRNTDGARDLLLNGVPQGCASLPPNLISPPAIQSTTFNSINPGCTRGGTCVTGSESAEYQVAFALACEAAAGGYATFDQMQQAMVDIAYVIRSRIRSGGFPDTALDVIRQSGAFQCYAEGASSNIDTVLATAAPLAEALVYNRTVIPPPSFPEIEYALFFFGLPWEEGSLAANSIDREVVMRYLTNADNRTPQPIVGVSIETLRGIYLGHGRTNVNRFGTFFFSDDPQFTGYIP